MLQRLAAVTILVPSYGEGIAFFRDVLGFAVVNDTPLSHTKRWVVVAPSADADAGAKLVLAVPSDERQRARVGDQTGGRVGLFVHSDDFWADYERLRERGVSFLETPRSETYGLVAVFVDPWGGKWDLLQPFFAPKSHEIRPTKLGRQVLFWGLGLAALLLAVYLLGSTITPFAAGIVLGYLLDPIVVKLQKFGFNRLGASLLILTVFVLFGILFFILVVPVLGNQFIEFAQHLPRYAVRFQAFAVEEGNALIAKYGGRWLTVFGLNQPLSSAQIQKSVGDFVTQSAQWLLDAFTRLVSGGAALFSFLSLLIVTPVVAFYILVDWRRMISKLDSWLPLDHRETMRNIAREINHALAGFIRGQSIVCLFLAVWYSFGLTLIGLDYGFLIGVVGGVLSFVPYLGSLTALVLSLSVALFQEWPSLRLFLLALGVVGAGQFLEGYVLSPQLVGESIGLHPVWLMFALLAFGQLFGFLGLLIAVPTAAAMGVVARHLIAVYLASSFYRGSSEPESQ